MPSRLSSILGHGVAVVVLALLVGVAGGALAVASLVGSDHKIHGCVDGKGHLRLVKPSKKCDKGEHAIAWNQRGPKGDKGATGARGPAAIKIDWHPVGASPRTPVASAGPWTVAFSCFVTGPFDERPQVTLFVKGPGTADYSTVESLEDSSPAVSTASVSLSASTFTQVLQTQSPIAPKYQRIIGDTYLSTDRAVAVLHVNILADNRTAPVCRAAGTLIPTG